MWKKIIRVDYDSSGLFAEGRSTMRKTPRVGLVPVALVAALVAPGVARSVCRARESRIPPRSTSSWAERTYRAQCGRCHGRDARGGQETGAPDLTVPLDANTDPELFAGDSGGHPWNRDDRGQSAVVRSDGLADGYLSQLVPAWIPRTTSCRVTSPEGNELYRRPRVRPLSSGGGRRRPIRSGPDVSWHPSRP